MIELHIDARKRKQLSKNIVTATIGGKIAIGLGILCLVLAVAVPCYLMMFTSGFLSDDGPLFDAILAASLFGVCALFLFACTYRQRNAKLSMRLEERLYIDNGFLYYFYHLSNDTWWRFQYIEYGVTSYVVDLRNTRIRAGERPFQYFLEGGVYIHRYVNPTPETVMVPLNAMKRVEDAEGFPNHLEIYDYWMPSLYSTIVEEQKKAWTPGYGQQPYINGRNVFSTPASQQPYVQQYQQPMPGAGNIPNTNATPTPPVNQTIPVKPQSNGSPVIPYIAAGIFILALLWGLYTGRWSVLAGIPFIIWLIAKGNNRRH